MATRQKPGALNHGIKRYRPKRGEPYMSEPQATYFREVLQAWRSELGQETTNTVVHIQDDTANHPDPTDRATQETDMVLELRGRDRDRKLIKKINDSLHRLGSGDFGYCDNCGEEIGLKRLDARPTAELCIDCKTLDEIREKQVS